MFFMPPYVNLSDYPEILQNIEYMKKINHRTKKSAIPIGMGSLTVKPCLFPGMPVKVAPADEIHFLPITSECFDGSGLNKFHLDECTQWVNIK